MLADAAGDCWAVAGAKSERLCLLRFAVMESLACGRPAQHQPSSANEAWKVLLADWQHLALSLLQTAMLAAALDLMLLLAVYQECCQVLLAAALQEGMEEKDCEPAAAAAAAAAV